MMQQLIYHDAATNLTGEVEQDGVSGSVISGVEAIELPGVEEVVPNGIEAASHGGEGVEERVAHPDG